MANASNPIDLGKLFQTVAGALAQNRDSLNSADTKNHDHGDNMVNTFELITRAMQEKKGANAAEQMAYAAEVLKGQRSGSAQLYANGLSQASQQFQGQDVTADNALAMLSTLLGGGGGAAAQGLAGLMVSPTDGAYVSGNNIRFEWRASPGASKYWLIVRRVKDGSPRISKDLGNVLSSEEYGFADDSTQYKWTVGVGDNPEKDATWWNFTNGAYVPPRQTAQAQPQQQVQQDAGIGDIIGTLIRQAQGKKQAPQPTEGVGDIIGQLIRQTQGKQQASQPTEGVGDIIGQLIRQAQGKQQAKGKSGLEAIVNTVVSNSAMGGSYREQSGSVVANALITAIGNMVNKK